MRSLRTALALLILGSSAGISCSSDVGSRGLAIHDPLALIDDVQGPLRLYVLPADMFSCDNTTGLVSPDVPDVGEGMFAAAVADLSLNVSDSRAMAEINVPGGDYTVLVRGKGTDPVTLRTDVFIATGCTASAISEGETREVRITLLPILGMGVCGDGTLSPDEQCEDSNTADGDGCSSTCRTEPFAVNTTTAGTQNHPSVGGAQGQRWSITYDSENATSVIRTLAPDGSAITSPSVLMNDADIDDVFPDVGIGSQLLADVAVAGDGRIAMAFVDFNGGRDIRVGLFDSSRAVLGGGTVRVVDGMATAPSIAYTGGGALMVVYEDAASTTGLMGAVFAAGSTTVGAPFEVGAGLTGASAPDIAGSSDGFVVAMTAGGDVSYQRFMADGSARDAAAVSVSAAAGTQDQPAVAAQSSGAFAVVWRDELLDGDGTGIGARAFGADGSAQGDAFVLNSEVGGAQEAPAVTARGAVFGVAFISAGSARGRILSTDGTPLPNRDPMPSTAEFELSASASEVAVAAGGTDTAPVWMVVTESGGNIQARFFPLP